MFVQKIISFSKKVILQKPLCINNFINDYLLEETKKHYLFENQKDIMD